MTTLRYVPELLNPPGDAGVGFAYLDPSSKGFNTLALEPGTNRKVDDEVWAVLKDTQAVQALVKIGAIEELVSKPRGEAEAAPAVRELEDVLGLSVQSALKVVDDSKDAEFLEAWKKGEHRQTVINRLNMRITNIAAGKA